MSNIVRFDSLRIATGVDIATASGSYIVLGIQFTHAMRVLHFINDTNALMYISFDAVNDNIVITPGAFVLYDLTSDQDFNEKFRYQNGSQLYVKYVGSAPSPVMGSSNSVYAVSVYGKGE